MGFGADLKVFSKVTHKAINNKAEEALVQPMIKNWRNNKPL